MSLCHLIGGSQDEIMRYDSLPEESFKCDSCEEPFYRGQGAKDPSIPFYFCHRCIRLKYYRCFYQHGTMTDDQIENVVKSFIHL